MKTEKPDISLTYKKKDGTDQWFMTVDKKPEKGPGDYDKLVVGQGDDGIFVFEIKTNNITFDPNNPIEIRTADGGPGLPGQFMTKLLDGKLVVADPNSDQVATDYYYQLNFVGAKPLDPVIQNGCCKTSLVGTGGSGVQLMSVTGAIAVLLVSALLTSFFIAWTRWSK